MTETLVESSKPEPPEWVTGNTENWEDEGKENTYYVGRSIPSYKDHPGGWTRDNAYSAAMEQVQSSLAARIGTEVKSTVEYKARDRQGKLEEEQKMDLFARSAAFFQGLVVVEEYWEKYEVINKGRDKSQPGRADYFRSYLKMRIPNEEIKKAMERINDQSVLEQEEERFFQARKKEHAEILKKLNQIDLSNSDQVKEYNGLFNTMLSINASLRQLTILRRNAEKSEEIDELINAIADDIREYDPLDRLRQMNRYLTEQIRRTDSELRAAKAANDASSKTMNQLKTDLMREIENLRNTGQGTVNTYIANSNYFFPATGPGMVRTGTGGSVSKDFIKNKDMAGFLAAGGAEGVTEFSKNPNNPAVNVSFLDAARFCNWLSSIYGYDECYVFTGDDTVSYRNANGYRLPDSPELDGAYKGNLLNTHDLIEWSNSQDNKAHGVKWQNGRLNTPAAAMGIKETHSNIGFRVARTNSR
jgi:hypothetical protein